jgi:hypothetical protein
MAAMFVNGSELNEQLSDYRLLGASGLKSSPLKPLGQMNRNLVSSIYGRSSIKIVHFGPIRNKHGHHRQFLMLIGQFLKKIFSSETA